MPVVFMLLPEGLLQFRKHTSICVSRYGITQNTPQASLTVNCSYSITLKGLQQLTGCSGSYPLTGTGFRNACCSWCIKWRKYGLVLSGHRSFQPTCGPVFPLLFYFSLFFALSSRCMEGQWGVLSLFEGRELWNSSPTVFLTKVVLTEINTDLLES